MEQLNDDCLIYIAKFLSFRDKISFIQTCKKIYNLHSFIFKNELILYTKHNRNWILKYKSNITLEKKIKIHPEFKVKSLRWEHKKIYKFPKFNTSFITSLILNYNNFTEIPRQVFELTNLSKLEMNSNLITCIPHEICNLTKLKCLFLKSNQIHIVSSNIKYCTQLEELYLTHNLISNLPCAIGNLTNLKMLYLGCNQIERFGDEFTLLINLHTLVLDYNQLQYVTPCLNIMNLVYLDLSFNPNLKKMSFDTIKYYEQKDFNLE